MAFSHLIFAAASAAQPAQFAGVPLAAAEQIFQIELHRLPPEALKPLLFDADPRIRVRAVVAAGRLQAPTLLLAGLVADGEPTVRLAAVQALGFAPDAAALLRSRLSVESNPLVVGGILESLGRVGEAEDVAAVVVALQSPHAVIAARALGRMGMRNVEGAGSADTVSALLDTLGTPMGETRRSAAWAISRIPISPLPAAMRDRLATAALGDPESRVRSWLVRGAAPVVKDPQFLTAAAADTAAEVRLAAVRAIAKHGCQAAALTLRLADSEVSVRAEAIAAAGACRDVPIAPLLKAMNDGTTAEQAAALRSLQTRKALPLPLAAYQDPPWPLPVRIAAVESITERARLLRLALRHEDSRLRIAAVGMVLGEDDPPRTNEIVDLLASEDLVVVQAAADAAVEHPDPALEEPLLRVLARQNLVRAVAVSTVRALDALYATGRLAHPSPAAKAMIRRWLSAPELGKAAPRLCAALSLDPPRIRHPDRLLPQLAEVARMRSARVFTSEGEIRIELLPEVAPYTVWNFVSLAEQGYFNGLTFHRVVSDFVVQTGDPRGDGWGGPGFEVPDEFSAEDYATGTVGVARSGPDTGGSQWFVTTSPQPHLDFNYTVFGRVTQGIRAARAMDVDDTITRIVIERVP